MAKPKPKPTPSTPLIEIFDEVEQGSEEWNALRLGVPTASNFRIMMASGVGGDESKQREELKRKLAGEILTGRVAEGKIQTAAMLRGNEMEPAARAYYARTNLVNLRRVGFIRRRIPSGAWVGCSPDALISETKALEIKTMAPHLLIERLERGSSAPSEHRAQIHGTMWIADLKAVDLLLYYEGMPVNPRFTIYRDETYIREIARAVEIFEYEVRMLVEKIKRME